MTDPKFIRLVQELLEGVDQGGETAPQVAASLVEKLRLPPRAAVLEHSFHSEFGHGDVQDQTWRVTFADGTSSLLFWWVDVSGDVQDWGMKVVEEES